MDIRKISVGADYKSGAMHYIVGLEVLMSDLVVFMEREEVLLWKEFKTTMPVSLEYNINF